MFGVNIFRAQFSQWPRKLSLITLLVLCTILPIPLSTWAQEPASVNILMVEPIEVPLSYDEIMSIFFVKHQEQVVEDRYTWLITDSGKNTVPAINFGIEYASQLGDVRLISITGLPPSLYEGLAAAFPHAITLKGTLEERWANYKYGPGHEQMEKVKVAYFCLGKDRSVCILFLPDSASSICELAAPYTVIKAEQQPAYILDIPRKAGLWGLLEPGYGNAYRCSYSLLSPAADGQDTRLVRLSMRFDFAQELVVYQPGILKQNEFANALRTSFSHLDAGSKPNENDIWWNTSQSILNICIVEQYPEVPSRMLKWLVRTPNEEESIEPISAQPVLDAFSSQEPQLACFYALRDGRLFMLAVPSSE